jgi:hypothetical protein
MAQNTEHQNLDQKLNAERDTERIAGTVETVWEKAAAEMETAWEKTAKTMVQTEKGTAEMRKRTVKTWKTVKVNKKTEGGSLYQNRHNTRQTDGRTILYTLKQKETNREQEQELVY